MRGSAINGARGLMTVMAYKEGVHTVRIRRFSDDKRVNRKYRVGNSENNNKAMVRLSAPYLATRGDESSECRTMGKDTVVRKKFKLV